MVNNPIFLHRLHRVLDARDARDCHSEAKEIHR